MTPTLLFLIACYVWTLMVVSNNPSELDARKAISAPLTICLMLCAMLLVWLSNLFSGMDSEVML